MNVLIKMPDNEIKPLEDKLAATEKAQAGADTAREIIMFVKTGLEDSMARALAEKKMTEDDLDPIC